MQAFKSMTVFIVLLGLSVICFFPHSTKSTEIGVRVVKWRPLTKRAIVPDIYAQGAT